MGANFNDCTAVQHSRDKKDGEEFIGDAGRFDKRIDMIEI